MATLRVPHLDDVPTFFRWQCNNARNVGEDGFLEAGYELACALMLVRPADCGSDEWDRELSALSDLVLPIGAESRMIDATAKGDDGILRWFADHFPACMELIAGQGRKAFLAGVHRAVNEGVIELG